MKFDQDLEGLLWTGKEEIIKHDREHNLILPPFDLLLERDSWKEYWTAFGGARLATLPEVYQAVRKGLIADTLDWGYIMGTEFNYLDGRKVDCTEHGIKRRMAIPQVEWLDDFVNDCPIVAQELFFTQDNAEKMLGNWKRYFSKTFRQDARIRISFNIAPEEKTRERCAALLRISGDLPTISLAYIPANKARSYGVEQ